MSRPRNKVMVHIGIGLAMCGVTAASAILVKQTQGRVHPLAAVELVPLSPALESAATQPKANSEPVKTVLAAPEPASEQASYQTEPDVVVDETAVDETTSDVAPELLQYATDAQVRWFNGRPIRPARQMWMTVTGYSPDARSCGDSADGITATLHSVSTNNMNLVAADTRILPFGSMISIPGYDTGKIVPVLDCGGAIKGRRLDLLFPTHEEARRWGVKKLLVTVYDYADGKPADNPRKLR